MPAAVDLSLDSASHLWCREPFLGVLLLLVFHFLGRMEAPLSACCARGETLHRQSWVWLPESIHVDIPAMIHIRAHMTAALLNQRTSDIPRAGDFCSENRVVHDLC